MAEQTVEVMVPKSTNMRIRWAMFAVGVILGMLVMWIFVLKGVSSEEMNAVVTAKADLEKQVATAVKGEMEAKSASIAATSKVSALETELGKVKGELASCQSPAPAPVAAAPATPATPAARPPAQRRQAAPAPAAIPSAQAVPTTPTVVGELWKFRFEDSNPSNPKPCAVDRQVTAQKPDFCSRIDVIPSREGESRGSWRARVAGQYGLVNARTY